MHLIPLTTREADPDDELRAWYEIQAEIAAKHAEDDLSHRCPSDMPPCPECEELYDAETYEP
jgi:hypothetical protein